MNSREYIQTLKECIISLTREDVTDTIIEALDALRYTHKKFQDEMDYYLVYPRHDLKLANDTKSLIVSHCDEYGFKYIFTATDSSWFKKGYFVRYYLNAKEITNLIVYKKSDKNKPTNPIDEITINDL